MKSNTKHINLIKRSESQLTGSIVSVYGGTHPRTIIFCETKRECNEIILHSKLPSETQPLNGDIHQQQRTVVTLEGFKNGKFKCLQLKVQISHKQIQLYNVILLKISYIQRSGRTGRAGKDRICITFYSKKDITLIERVERIAKIKFIKISAPQHQDIIKASSRDLQTSLQVVSKEIVDLFQPVAQEIIQRCDPVEALARQSISLCKWIQRQIIKQINYGIIEGYITYLLNISTSFQACGYIWKFLKNNFSEQICNSIKGMKKLKNQNGVAFDITEDDKEQFENQYLQLASNGYCTGIQIEQATTLPDIIEEQYLQHQNYHQQPIV
ncbi:unnamed protein product [Paramecium sonneborni]|uniref:RNA helicase n=1 Tax=Paramecium sonneborni TaxID=65129 RepID=A0A8S1K9Q2_9CILI|nr:unnamed protein product [Paramecium sonneborni]